MKCVNLAILSSSVFFTSTAVFADSLKIRHTYVSTNAVKNSSDPYVEKMKQTAIDFEHIAPAGGEIRFTRDIIFDAKAAAPIYDGSASYPNNLKAIYPYYEIGTKGHVGDKGNRSYFLMCNFELTPDKINRRFIESESKVKIKSVDLKFEVTLGWATQVNEVRINFDHESLKNMTCSISDNVYGFENRNVTPELFIRGAEAFISSTSFILPKGKRL